MARTRTGTSHWHVQEERRRNFLEQARRSRRTLVRGADVTLVETERGTRRGTYIGMDEGNPPLTIDAHVHEIAPGVTTTSHQHSWDAILFCMDGTGWIEIDGQRIDWKPWDAIYVPSWAWHRVGNDSDRAARYYSFSTEPLFENLGVAELYDEADLASGLTGPLGPRRPTGDDESVPPSTDDESADPYARRKRRLARQVEERFQTRLHTPYDDLGFGITPRGAKTSLLVDPTLGYKTSGLTAALKIYFPGTGETMHAHPGEAWLLCVEGHGHSYIGDEPEGGEDFHWERGDLVAVDHFAWHRHFNDHPSETARLVRIHIVDTFGSIARALSDPIKLKHEPDWALAQASDLSRVTWPDENRPD